MDSKSLEVEVIDSPALKERSWGAKLGNGLTIRGVLQKEDNGSVRFKSINVGGFKTKLVDVAPQNSENSLYGLKAAVIIVGGVCHDNPKDVADDLEAAGYVARNFPEILSKIADKAKDAF